MKMRDFFTFYKDIQGMELPFQAFHMFHCLFIGIAVVVIYVLLSHYRRLDEDKQRQMQVHMAMYFLVEELIYTIWLFIFCHDHVWHEVLPLELCSLCAYMNALSVYLRWDSLRFFSGVVGLCAGLVAMLYPANISGLYPVLSYRVINFYILHGAFVLFALMQLQDRSLLGYRYVNHNFLILCAMFTTAFVINLQLDTQYMFVGIPPKIGFIASLYHITGFALFLPVILFILYILHYVILFAMRKLYHIDSPV